jgi:hypothetical protein
VDQIAATVERVRERPRVQQVAVRPFDVIVERDMRIVTNERTNAVTGSEQRAQNVRPDEPRSAG